MKKEKLKKIIGTVLMLMFFISSQLVSAKTIAVKKVVVKKDFITIQVPGNTYKALVKEGESLYDVMKNVSDKKDSKFSFHSQNYSSLGNFIDEINGIKGTPGRYWIYYVNNKKAPVGVSKYLVKPGDIISWKQEGI